MKRKYLAPLKMILMLLPGLVGLAACNLPSNAANTTATLNVTQAYETVAARLTQAAVASPLAPTVSLPTATQNVAPTETSSATTPTVTPSPKASSTPAVKACDQAEAGTPIDVTIQDDTQMTPGQTFTKVWRLRNSGTCSWSKDYSIAVFSGEAMSAPSTVPLPNKIEPGQSMDISVDLVAPLNAGTYQGNWKLRNASGTWFGIGPGGSSPFWVRIKVVGNGTITVTPGTATPATATSTSPNPYPGATESANPGVQVNGNNNLVPNDRINLDTNQINVGGEDLSYQPNAKGKLTLSPMGNVGFAGFGGKTPSYSECKALPLGGGSAVVANLSAGFYICYRTDQGLYGWLRLLAYNPETGMLSIQINTWALP
jgi:Ig-like domain from next to BRCA1 gene